MFLTRPSDLFRRTAIRQSLSLLAVFLTITVFAWVGTYWLVRSEMNQLIDIRLAAQMPEVVSAHENGDLLPEPGLGQSFAVVRGGQTLQGGLPIDLLLAGRGDGFHSVDAKDRRKTDYRIMIETIGGAQFVLAESVERQEELLEVLWTGLQFTLLASLGAAVAAGIWMARRGQIRLDGIRDGLAQVAQGNLAARIALPGRRDDLSIVADRINATTERLERAMDQMRVQSKNIAHDLRTPLARLRALIEGSLIALVERDQPVSADTLEDALDHIDRIVGTFDALLRIARIESGTRKASFAPVDLGELAESVAETFGPVVEDAGARLDLSITDPQTVRGDRDLIVQLAANLIQNALRYGPEGQTISLSVHGAHLWVTDQGPGIPVAERAKVLEPLYQLEGGRQSEGYGLGLSLVRAISDLHAARLTLSDGPRGCGLKAAVQFPKLAEL